MTEPFRWKNCHADVATSMHGQTAQGYLREVVEPALTVLDRKLAELQSSDDPLDAFVQADVEELQRVTVMGFCLSIQSLWERQIRAYLRGCATELRPAEPSLAKKTMKGEWKDIDGLFQELRGISLTVFPQYPRLDVLHLLGNVCRHGDGPSLETLFKGHPELWPYQDYFDETPFVPTIDGIVIPRDLLQTFVAAIAGFWDETEYIYNESIERKHPSLEAKLIKIRLERTRRGSTP